MAKSTAATTSKMELARAIVLTAFQNAPKDGQPRKDAIQQLMAPVKNGGLGMKNTTAATYFAHCMKHFREAQQSEALAKAESGKPVYTAYKTDSKGVITSAGAFLTQKAAKEFNVQFRHDGVVKGLQTIGKPVKKAA